MQNKLASGARLGRQALLFPLCLVLYEFSTYIGNGGWNNQDIALVKADGKEVHNLTNSGYSDSNGKWGAIADNMTALSGSTLVLLDELYKSETATNFNNRSIAWLLKNYGRIYDDPDMSLDLYTRQCSMGVTAKQLAIAGCTIANGGLNPVTKEQVFKEELSPKITSLIATVGFYEHTGDWLYNSGIPAKSGVGGGVLGVMPGAFGIAAFAPPLDEFGNSVKAQAAIKYITQKLGLNIFRNNNIDFEM